MSAATWWLLFVAFALVAYFGVALVVAVGGVNDLRALLKQLAAEKDEL